MEIQAVIYLTVFYNNFLAVPERDFGFSIFDLACTNIKIKQDFFSGVFFHQKKNSLKF